MYTKQELEAMEIPLLMDIANKLGVKVTPNDELEEVIYAILDKAAVDAASTAAPAKKKRTRIVKKDTNKVYTVNGKEGENFDVKTGKKKKATKPAPLFNNIAFENGEEIWRIDEIQTNDFIKQKFCNGWDNLSVRVQIESEEA